MKTGKALKLALQSSALWTALLTLIFLFFSWSENSLSELFLCLPFFIVLYYFFCSIGKKEVITKIRRWIGSDVVKVMLFPAILMVLYFFYILINNLSPFKGTFALLPYLIFPVLVFLVRRHPTQKIDWLDFAAFVIFLLLTTFIKVDPSGNLPFTGKDFGSVYKIALMLIAVYAFGTIRGLNEIGFVPVLNYKYLWTATWVWFAFYVFVFVIGYHVNFIKYVGHESITQELVNKIGLTLVVTYLNTAIFEELFFRGILQNMLTKRIGQAKSWKVFWQWGILLSIPLALLVGYTLKGGMQWFPALMVILIFTAAFLIERTGKQIAGVYTALAITSALFGLVHYHSGAIIYIGFACVAGWAYGYTYIKTKNVFYSALVHTLVNSSVLIFGLEFMK